MRVSRGPRPCALWPLPSCPLTPIPERKGVRGRARLTMTDLGGGTNETRRAAPPLPASHSVAVLYFPQEPCLSSTAERRHALSTIRVALAQINSTVGDLRGNADKIRRSIDQAKAADADIVAFPELALTGYPPEDLLLKPQFLDDHRLALQELIPFSAGITAIVGCLDINSDLYNAAAVLADGKLVGMYHKMFLPNYGVFDEDRYFKAGRSCPVFTVQGVGVGVNVCEDIWYALGPTPVQAGAGAQVIVSINASPYNAGKIHVRDKFTATRAWDNGVYICYVNLVGGQDELVFDGGSMIVDPSGKVIARAAQFEEEMLVADLDISSILRQHLREPRLRKQRLASMTPDITAPRVHVSDRKPPGHRPKIAPRVAGFLSPAAEVYQALVTGTRDYVQKSGFQRVLIGLSGGIDSSLVATIAADALGKEAVVGVAMPSRFNAPESLEDARIQAHNLGIEFHVIPIEPPFQAMLDTMAGMFEGVKPNTAEENIQARIRGMILMAMSNKFGWMVLTTGNKSEMAMGYATLYGDMAGGFAVIKDVLKTLV
ncbi:MAG: NAD+ synthase, partial [Dehalococcoidia bacterium]|nr:NAD+ synthase [Dehalococcoidia bacterium]